MKQVRIDALTMQFLFGRQVVSCIVRDVDSGQVIATGRLAQMLTKFDKASGFEIVNTDEVLRWMVLTCGYAA